MFLLTFWYEIETKLYCLLIEDTYNLPNTDRLLCIVFEANLLFLYFLLDKYLIIVFSVDNNFFGKFDYLFFLLLLNIKPYI